MVQVERYRIILTGMVISGYQTQDVVADLSRLFRITQDRVMPLLAGEPSMIRRDLILEKAVRLRNKIEQRGAVCNLRVVLRDESEVCHDQLEATGILEPDLDMEQTQLILTEETLESIAPKPPLFKSQRAESQRGSWGLISVVLLATVLVTVMAWDYFNPSQNGHHSDPASRVFTFSPAKSAGRTEGYPGSAGQLE